MMLLSSGASRSWIRSVTMMRSVVRRATSLMAPQGSRRCSRMAPNTATSNCTQVPGQVVEVAVDQLGGRPVGRCMYHQLLWTPSTVVCMSVGPVVRRVTAVDREEVDGDVEPGLEGDHLGPLAIHVEGQVARCGAGFDHPLAADVDAAQVGPLAAPEVPGTVDRRSRRGGRRRGTSCSRRRWPKRPGGAHPPWNPGSSWPRYCLRRVRRPHRRPWCGSHRVRRARIRGIRRAATAAATPEEGVGSGLLGHRLDSTGLPPTPPGPIGARPEGTGPVPVPGPGAARHVRVSNATGPPGHWTGDGAASGRLPSGPGQ